MKKAELSGRRKASHYEDIFWKNNYDDPIVWLEIPLDGSVKTFKNTERMRAPFSLCPRPSLSSGVSEATASVRYLYLVNRRADADSFSMPTALKSVNH
jgi:hypothetical protein